MTKSEPKLWALPVSMDSKPTNTLDDQDADANFALVRRLREKDPTVFELIYDRYNRIVFAVIFRITTDEMLSEDLTQAVFLKLWTHHYLFKGGNLAAWLTRIARNKAIDAVRSSKCHREELVEAPDSCASFDVAEVVVSNSEASRLRTALALLPSEMRSAIELGFFGGLSYPEIARLKSAPLGTIKSRVQKGLRHLRATLEPSLISP